MPDVLPQHRDPAPLRPAEAPWGAGVTVPSADQPRPGDPPVLLRSEDVLKGGREAVILHAGEAYRLRLTSNGKLILTK